MKSSTERTTRPLVEEEVHIEDNNKPNIFQKYVYNEDMKNLKVEYKMN
jgi:hypothetical protein